MHKGRQNANPLVNADCPIKCFATPSNNPMHNFKNPFTRTNQETLLLSAIKAAPLNEKCSKISKLFVI